MFNLHEPPSKNQRNIEDFEAEMEAELDRRALEIEIKGGMEHQRSLSRSSSNASLNKSPRASPVPGSSADARGTSVKKSSLKRRPSNSSDCGEVKPKSVKFACDENSDATRNLNDDGTVATTASAQKPIAQKLYDELYFDSDDEEKDDKKGKEKRRFMTDDELFYDPSSDAKDQAWIDKKRRKAYGESKAFPPPASQGSGSDQTATADSSSSSSSNLPNTDAVLNCPACFTTVCHDCQRHELYVGQYRAMFVSNCVINKQETLKIPEKQNSKKVRKNKKNPNSSDAEFFNDSGSDSFHPVMCRVCSTQLAMYDSDEVYHFFNVLASQP